jgi:hypothetical protein
MAGSSIAGIITATTLLITAIGGAFTAYGVMRQLRRADKKADELQQTANETHVIVNQQHTDTMNFQRALIRRLNEAGIDIPVDQSLPDVVEP